MNKSILWKNRDGELVTITPDDYKVASIFYGLDSDAATVEYYDELAEQVKPSKKLQRSVHDKIVCYCGSLRKAKEAFKWAEYESLMKGEIALLPCCMFVDIEREYGLTSQYKQMADEQHLAKIEMANEVVILNVGGYIGESTQRELDYARSLNKPVKFLEPLLNSTPNLKPSDTTGSDSSNAADNQINQTK